MRVMRTPAPSLVGVPRSWAATSRSRIANSVVAMDFILLGGTHLIGVRGGKINAGSLSDPATRDGSPA
jgi:hypothetical protein